MTLIKASITAGIRPTSMILHTDPRKKWDEYDFLLLEAYQILQEELCGQCGLPRWICHNEDERIQFRVEEEQCAAIRDKDKAEEKKTKKSKKLDGGVTLTPRPFTTDGSDLSEFRRLYYKQLEEKREHTD